MTDPTEGPWIRHGISAGCHMIRAATGRIVGFIGIQGIDPRTWFVDEIDRANATLIAAAPDLLVACRAADRFVATLARDGNEAAAVFRLTREALALANGEARHDEDPDPGVPTWDRFASRTHALAPSAPRRTEVDDLREALEEAAASLETASRWNTRNVPEANHGWQSLRGWARSRAAAARRALESRR